MKVREGRKKRKAGKVEDNKDKKFKKKINSQDVRQDIN